MKRHFILPLIIGALMTSVCVQGISAQAAEKISSKKYIEKQKVVGQIYNNDDVSSLTFLSDGVSNASKAAVLPERYDFRTKGLVTPVKEQGNYGTCWSFAAMNSAESSLLTRYPKVDLSEWMTSYYTYCKQFGFPFENDEASIFDQGGKYKFTSAMLSAGIGAFNERFEKWYYGDKSIEKDDSDVDFVRNIRDYQVTNIEYFPYWQTEDVTFKNQIHAIKNEVYNGHSPVLSYFNCDDYYNEKYYSYYIDENYANINDGYSTYHSVSIVGWDDNFSAKNFKSTPPMNGAWLCKNSWGENWGDGGYFWISYADASVYDIFYIEAEPVQKYADIHLYDSYGFTNFISSSSDLEQTEYDYMANVFKAEEETMVTAVMLCTTIPDENYEITVYTDLSDLSDPCSGKPNKAASGIVPNTGYHTIDLEKPVGVKEGESYSVVVKIGGELGYHIACEGYLDYEFFYEDGTSEYTEDKMKKYVMRDFDSNQSFISADGKKWTDNYDVGVFEYETQFDVIDDDENVIETEKCKCYESVANNCIKVFTRRPDSVIFSEYASELPIGKEIALESPGGKEIKYSINGGTYKTYTEPFIFNGDMTISAYVNKDKIYERSYFQQKTVLSSALVRNEYGSSYIYENWENPEEYVVYLNGREQSIDIQLIAMGDISINGKSAKSGEYYTVSTKNDINTILVDISEEGKLSSQYSITFMHFYPMKGDINTDEIIDISDASAVLRYYAENIALVLGNDELTAQQSMNGDVNEDMRIDIIDASIILKYYAYKIADLKPSWDSVLNESV